MNQPKPALWAVVMHGDYSGTKIFESQDEARKFATQCSDSMRSQVGVYGCELDAVAIPAPSTLMPAPSAERT